MIAPWKLTAVLAMGLALLAMPVTAEDLQSSNSGATRSGAVELAQAAQPAPTAPSGQGTHEPAKAGDHAASGAVDDEHHGSGTFPPFDATTFASQILWLALSFGLLYWLMSRVALPRIGSILEERHERIADDLEEASKHKADSEAAKTSYEKALAEARSKANTIAGETRNRLTAEAETNRKNLEASLASKLQDAEARIASTKTEALTHVRGIAVDTAQSIVSTLVGNAPAQADVEKAVDSALASKPAA